MSNTSTEHLENLKEQQAKYRRQVRHSMDRTEDKDTDHYEHMQHLINTYNRIIDILDDAIESAENIGKGI